MTGREKPLKVTDVIRLSPYQILRLIALFAFLAGVFFRFSNLDRKIFWHDEVLSALRLSGLSLQDVEHRYPRPAKLTFGDLEGLQRIQSGRGLGAIIRSSLNSPHYPLYYLSLRLWADCVGDSVVAIRAFSTFLSVINLALAWWLARLLFRDHISPWIVFSLLSLSPFQLATAQETRMYPFLILGILLSTGLLIRCTQSPSPMRWTAYSVSLLISLGVHPLALPLIATHGAWIAWRMVFKRKFSFRSALSWALSATIAIGIAAPWLEKILFGNILQTHPTAKSVRPETLLPSWISTAVRFFSELHLHFAAHPLLAKFFLIVPFLLIVIALLAATRGAFQRRVDGDGLVLMLLFILIPFLSLALPDIFKGGSRSTVIRYLTPAGLGLTFVLSWFLSLAFQRRTDGGSRTAFSTTVLVAFLAAGTASLYLQQQFSLWQKDFPGVSTLPEVIAVTTKDEPPLFVSTAETHLLLSLSRALPSSVRMLLLPEDTPLTTKECGTTEAEVRAAGKALVYGHDKALLSGCSGIQIISVPAEFPADKLYLAEIKVRGR